MKYAADHSGLFNHSKILLEKYDSWVGAEQAIPIIRCRLAV